MKKIPRVSTALCTRLLTARKYDVTKIKLMRVISDQCVSPTFQWHYSATQGEVSACMTNIRNSVIQCTCIHWRNTKQTHIALTWQQGPNDHETTNPVLVDMRNHHLHVNRPYLRIRYTRICTHTLTMRAHSMQMPTYKGNFCLFGNRCFHFFLVWSAYTNFQQIHIQR